MLDFLPVLGRLSKRETTNKVSTEGQELTIEMFYLLFSALNHMHITDPLLNL